MDDIARPMKLSRPVLTGAFALVAWAGAALAAAPPAPATTAAAPLAAPPVAPAPAAPAPATLATVAPPPVTPAPVTKVAAGGILGRAVLGPDGHEIGRVVDVLVDAGSNPRAAVIDVGGFLGVGSRRVAVDWSDMTFPPLGSGGDLKLDLSLDQIRSAPAYTDQTKPASVVEPPPVKVK
jgi:hypothetical protein